MTPIAVFLNPHARKNRDVPEDHAAYLERMVGKLGRIYETTTLADLRAAVRDAFEEDAKYYVADGGDGSFNCALHELRLALEEWGCDADDVPPITPTRSGAIDFLARKIGLTGNTATILQRLTALERARQTPRVVKLESMRLTGTRITREGKEARFERLGFALAAGGVGQRFFTKYYAETPGPEAIVKVVTKSVGSHLLSRVPFPLPSALGGYGNHVFTPTRARVTIDGDVLPDLEHGAIHAGAFDVSLGGVFHVFPLARDPGVLHFQAGRIRPREMIRSLPDLVRGARIHSDGLVERAGREMRVEALGTELLAPIIDGEEIANVKELTVTHGPAIPIPLVD